VLALAAWECQGYRIEGRTGPLSGALRQNGVLMIAVALCVPLAWLLGTFPSAELVARAKGRDITAEGSGNPGASNVARLLGWRYGAIVLLLDFAKGALAAGAGLWIGGRPGAYVLGIAAVVGHMFPLYRKGGKGIATGGGWLVVLFPVIVVILAVVWVVVARVFKKASLASLLITVLFPIAAAIAGYDWWEVAVLAAMAVLVIGRHAANIRRLIHREEMNLNPAPE
jgi:acyl phosphate:glycerol-3-phosphate acyltransferase